MLIRKLLQCKYTNFDNYNNVFEARSSWFNDYEQGVPGLSFRKDVRIT